MLTDLLKLANRIENSAQLRQVVRVNVCEEILLQGNTYPLISYSLGSTKPTDPTIMITGGFHGLEKVGAQLAWSLLKSTIDRLAWDRSLNSILENIRLLFFPLVNPVGYQKNTRANGQGVDLMRNAPIDAIARTPPLLGGHRISARLPWYRGALGQIELENKTLFSIFEREVLMAKTAIAVDFHSGFGLKDRLWFPYSYTPQPFDHLVELHALVELFENTHPYHIYQIEPQANGYLLNGDVWDFLYMQYRTKNPKGVFIPFTLEMGSWSWVRKNPLQLFSRHGVFNPVKEHRLKRTYRRHHLLFDFLLKAIHSHDVWSQLEGYARNKHEKVALTRWYK